MTNRVIEQSITCPNCGVDTQHNFWSGQSAVIAIQCGKCGHWMKFTVTLPQEENEPEQTVPDKPAAATKRARRASR
jgi:hypothetical protein